MIFIISVRLVGQKRRFSINSFELTNSFLAHVDTVMENKTSGEKPFLAVLPTGLPRSSSEPLCFISTPHTTKLLKKSLSLFRELTPIPFKCPQQLSNSPDKCPLSRTIYPTFATILLCLVCTNACRIAEPHNSFAIVPFFTTLVTLVTVMRVSSSTI